MILTRKNLDWWCERGILLLVLAALIFSPLAFGAVFTWSFLVVQALTMGIASLWLVRLWCGDKPKVFWPPLAWAVLAFAGYALVRYFTADIEYVARLEVIQVLMYALLLLAVLSNLYDQEAAEVITYVLTAVAALAASYAVAQYFRHSNQVWNLTSPYPGRASGTFINPNHFAAFMEVVLPLALAFLMVGRIGALTRVLLGYAILTMLAGLAVTFSRGGWVAATAGILLLLGFLVCHRNHRLRALVVLAVLVAVGFFFTAHCLSHSAAYRERVVRADENSPGVLDTGARLQMWGAAVDMWRDHPWWGVGPGHYDFRFREYRPEGFQQRPLHAHNDYVELLADWGLAGGVIVLVGVGIFLVGLKQSWPHVRRQENDFGTGMSSRYAFFLGAVCGLFALAVHSVVDFSLHITADALTGIVVLGLAASNLRFATKRYWVRARLPVQVGFSAALAGLILYFGVQFWHRGGEMLWTKRAEVMPTYSLEQVAALRKAQEFEPKDSLTDYNIGECFRIKSFEGGDDNEELARQALKYYAAVSELDPYDAYCQLRTGMCLDWLDRHQEAEKYYAEAEKLDPNGNYVVANIGWHYAQIGDYAAARQWFIRAEKLSNGANNIAKSYLEEICEPKMLERASGKLPMSLFDNENGKDH
jgi:O-antigen ligase